jgi:hypothetical protein
MKSKTDYQKVVKAAAKETSKFMTAKLRTDAVASGWDTDVANSISVKFVKNAWKINVPRKYKDAVWAANYGSENSQPTAVLHRLDNSDEAEKYFLQIVSKMLKGKI